jgi:hypothetical protein
MDCNALESDRVCERDGYAGIDYRATPLNA